jgi:hypothetical protein
MDDLFRQYYERYQQLHYQLERGGLTPQQFKAEVAKLRWQDNFGVWWALDESNGALLRYDGAQWLPFQNPTAPPPPPVGNAMPPPPGAAGARPGGLRGMLIATPILALVPSIACGTLWFLYTFIGVFKNEGLAGLDFGTPIIIIGLPLLFWILKKPLDQLLLPLKPFLLGIPRPARLGISLAVPLVLSCGCSLTYPSGYLAMNVASFISIITAAVIMRY